MKSQLSFLFLLLLHINPVWAEDINEELQSFFDEIGGSANAVAPGSYHAQNAGYYTMGTYNARVPTKNVNLAHLQMPSYSVGCGGINMFTGSFSMLNSDQLIAAGKSVASGAAMYAFQIAIESVSPMVSNVMKDGLDFINEWNRFEINSCEMGKSLVDGALAAFDTKNKVSCRKAGIGSGTFTDAAQGREACESASKRKEVFKKNPEMAPNKNIAWEAIKKNKLLATTRDQKELFMTLSGTAVVKEANEKLTLTFHEPMADNAKVIDALLNGGEIQVLHCDEEDHCLGPTLGGKKVVIKEQDGFNQKIKRLLEAASIAIAKDEPLSGNDEKAYQTLLKSKTSLPIQKMLSVNVAYMANTNSGRPIDVPGYYESIALDIVFEFVTDILNQVVAASASVDFDDKKKQAWILSLHASKDSLRARRQNIKQNIAVNANLIEHIRMLEESLAGRVTSDFTNTLISPRGKLQ